MPQAEKLLENFIVGVACSEGALAPGQHPHLALLHARASLGWDDGMQQQRSWDGMPCVAGTGLDTPTPAPNLVPVFCKTGDGCHAATSSPY